MVLPTGFEPGAPTITVHAAGVDRPQGAGHGLLEGSLDEAGAGGAMTAGAGGAPSCSASCSEGAGQGRQPRA